ncbi:arylsulfatase A-like enzyme [Prosthecobacter fusiformis]|uniref:Arylsulfatase A-like enzyme n=1 Tax=Prosthecobacter fusiformis TaxID=48464 RepID=A0A4V3FFI5_9BACT|nr:sulfatase-like hydrolase/transferase [Prosthecobacter fusiformis]TDU70953.1 arylsulfatase A-like enzyme [Prosthecobacter fusiformis]
MRLCLFLSLSAQAFAGSPNILFILADDQAWNGTSVAMIPGDTASRSQTFRTPNLDRLASQGMTFSQAYAAHCKCECSRASLQMGRSTTTLNAPDKTARNWSAPVSESITNLLKRAHPAYRTAHLGKWQWFHTPESMGYDVSDGITTNEDGNSPDPVDPKLSFSMTRRAMTFMETQVKSGHPFFIQLSYYAVHPEAQALAATVKKYQSMGVGGGRGDRAVMAGMTEDLDTCVGGLMKKLHELRIAENTLVIYTSDNGGRTGVLNGGKGDLGEGGLRVPLIIRGPGIKGGSHCDEPVISYDLTATLLDFVQPGTVLPKGSEGGSWKPVLLNGGKGKIQRPIPRFVWHQAVEVEHPQSAIRMGDYKLLYFWDTREGLLFDLAQDKGETKDLAREKPELTAQMTAALKSHIQAGLGTAAFAALEQGQFSASKKGAPKKKKK